MTYGRRETIAAALLRNNEASQLKTDEDRTTGASRYRSRAMRLSTARRPRNKSWEAVERRRTEENGRPKRRLEDFVNVLLFFIFRFLLDRHFRLLRLAWLNHSRNRDGSKEFSSRRI